MIRTRYSIQLTHANGAAVPLAHRHHQEAAIDLVEELNTTTRLAVSVWDTQEGEPVYAVPALPPVDGGDLWNGDDARDQGREIPHA